MKKNKAAAIVLGTLVGLFTLYFLAFVIYNFKYSENILTAIATIAPTFMIYGIFSVILLMSGFGGWGKFMRKIGRHRDAENYEKSVKESTDAYEKVKTKYDKKPKRVKTPEEKRREREFERDVKLIEYEAKLETRGGFSKQNFIIGLVILLICSAVASLTLWLYGKENRTVNNGNFVETTATVMPVRVSGTDDEYTLAYVYYDEEGNPYVYNDTGIFSGVNFREGKTTIVYYNKYNPEITSSGSGDIGLLIVSVIFLGGGAVAFLVNVLKNSNVFIPIVFGGIFAFFGIGMCMLLMRAGGFTLWEAMMSGPLAFGSVLFGTLGALFIVFGFFNMFREIYYFSLHLIKKRKGNDRNGET